LRRTTSFGIGVGVAIGGAIFIALVLMNYYAVNNLQFRSKGMENFDFVTFSMDMQLDACNPTYFPAYFDKMLLVVNYKGKQFATMTLHGTTIMPKQAVTLNGNMAVNAQMVAGLFLQGFASAFSGQSQQAFNENDLTFKVALDTKTLGFIPLSLSHEFSYNEFQQIMNSRKTSQFSCV